LAHEKDTVNDGKSLAKYIQSIDGQNAIAKVIYRNDLRSGTMSSTSGLQHFESKYLQENFWLVDHVTAAKMSMKENMTADPTIDNKLLRVKFNSNFAAW